MENPTNAEGKKITGIGTPATRASIISSLIKRDYINKSKKNIGITDKGKFIITTCLKDENLSNFMSIETTTLWEQKLSDNPIEFLNSIKGFLTNCIQSSNLQVGNYKDSSLGNCPDKFALKEAENNRKEEKETIIKVLEDKSH
jgi:DNA topoisomerase-3